MLDEKTIKILEEFDYFSDIDKKLIKIDLQRYKDCLASPEYKKFFNDEYLRLCENYLLRMAKESEDKIDSIVRLCLTGK